MLLANIRKATESDAQAIAQILQELGWFVWLDSTSPQTAIAQIQQHIAQCHANDSHSIYVAENAQNQIVGYVAVHWLPCPFLPKPQAYISELFIHEAYRGQGIGKRLLETVATNNTAIWVAAIATAGAYRKDLGVQRRELLLLCATSLIGGVIGSVALLYTSPDVFKKLIPYLLLLATLIFTFSEPLKSWFQLQSQKSSLESPPIFTLMLAQLAIAIYGGFFGAGLGILMLATLTFLGIKSIHTMNAFKAFLGSCVNGIAIVPFIFAGVIVWYQTILMAVGASLGGYLCAHYARKLEPRLIQIFVMIVAFSMTIYFFIHG